MDVATLVAWRMHNQLLWGPPAGSAAAVLDRFAAS